MTRKKIFYPFGFRENVLDIQITESNIAGEEVDQDTSNKTIDITAFDDFSELVLEGRVQIDKKAVKDVLSVDEYKNPPLEIIVTVDCPKTLLRKSIAREKISDMGEKFLFDASLKRKEYRGKVKIGAYLARTADGEELPSRYADFKGARIADARPWTVYFEKGTPPQEYMDVQLYDFGDPEFPPNENELFWLDLRNPETPKIWINSGRDRIAGVMKDDGKQLEEEFKHVISDMVTIPVSLQLLINALLGLDKDEGGTYEWQEDVLYWYESRLWPNKNFEAFKNEVVEKRENPEEFYNLISDIVSESQTKHEVQDNLVSLIKYVE